MSAKAILVFCAQALFVQSALSQCTSRAAVAADLIAPTGLVAPYGLGTPFTYDGVAAPYNIAAPGLAGAYAISNIATPYEMAAPCAWAAPAMDVTPTSGGGLPVSSASAIAPVGLSVASENVYEGILAAVGEVPFVGTVAVEGVLPTAGAGAVNHACGNGVNAMASGPAAVAPSYAGAYGDIITPAAAIAPTAPFSPGLGYRAGWAGRGCGCGYAS